MKRKEKGAVALKAETGGKIIADGATFKGFDRIAETKTGGNISLKNASSDSNRNQLGHDLPDRWYKRPVGIILLSVISGTIVITIGYFLFQPG